MSKKDKLIAKQALEIEELKRMLIANDKLKRSLRGKFYNIGAPLNDNVLKFNQHQLNWCRRVVELVEDVNCIVKNQAE